MSVGDRVGAPVRVGDPGGFPATLRDLSRPGRRASSLPELDVPPAEVPADQRRSERVGLPEVSERDLVRHYTRLAQRNYGVDTGFYPLGSCSMKYNPKVAEAAASLPGFRRLHPLQPEHTVQGALELLWRLERALCEVTGMAEATFQPAAGWNVALAIPVISQSARSSRHRSSRAPWAVCSGWSGWSRRKPGSEAAVSATFGLYFIEHDPSG